MSILPGSSPARTPWDCTRCTVCEQGTCGDTQSLAGRRQRALQGDSFSLSTRLIRQHINTVTWKHAAGSHPPKQPLGKGRAPPMAFAQPLRRTGSAGDAGQARSEEQSWAERCWKGRVCQGRRGPGCPVLTAHGDTSPRGKHLSSQHGRPALAAKAPQLPGLSTLGWGDGTVPPPAGEAQHWRVGDGALGSRGYSHDGTHSAAVPLPHAAEPWLATDVPEL